MLQFPVLNPVGPPCIFPDPTKKMYRGLFAPYDDEMARRTSERNDPFQSGNGDSNGAGRVVESELKAYKNRAFSETGLGGGAGSTTIS